QLGGGPVELVAHLVVGVGAAAGLAVLPGREEVGVRLRGVVGGAGRGQQLVRERGVEVLPQPGAGRGDGGQVERRGGRRAVQGARLGVRRRQQRQAGPGDVVHLVVGHARE